MQRISGNIENVHRITDPTDWRTTYGGLAAVTFTVAAKQWAMPFCTRRCSGIEEHACVASLTLLRARIVSHRSMHLSSCVSCTERSYIGKNKDMNSCLCRSFHGNVFKGTHFFIHDYRYD